MKFFQYSRKKQVATSVWAIHFIVVLFLLIHHASIRSFKPSRPIAVRTIQPKSTPAPIQKTSAAPVKKEARIAKAKQIAPAPSKKSKPLDEITEALKGLETLGASKKNKIELPSLIQMEQQSVEPPSYSEFLIAYLQKSLDLPEYGKVQIKLMINKDGTLLASEILSSENPKNSEFLKNRLPELTFPCFNDFNIDEKFLSFTVSFCNEENIR